MYLSRVLHSRRGTDQECSYRCHPARASVNIDAIAVRIKIAKHNTVVPPENRDRGSKLASMTCCTAAGVVVSVSEIKIGELKTQRRLAQFQSESSLIQWSQYYAAEKSEEHSTKCVTTMRPCLVFRALDASMYHWWHIRVASVRAGFTLRRCCNVIVHIIFQYCIRQYRNSSFNFKQ